MQNKGFTLSHTIFILLIICILLIFSPNIIHRKSILYFECERVKDILLQKQKEALLTKTKQVIQISSTTLYTNNKQHSLARGINCSNHEVSFNQRGNVNLARTITCTYMDFTRAIVINLGNGNIYVR